MPVLPSSLDLLQNRIGYTFRNPALLVEALTHSSYLQEHSDEGANNQRLEFLGDAVLHLLLSEALFQLFPAEREGVLSRRRATLAKGEFLGRLACDVGIPAALRLGRSEEETGGRHRASIREDALEAVVGAIYLDSDLATTRRVVLGLYGSLTALLNEREERENPKGQLQEIVQPVHGNDALRYEVVAIAGPGHAREFEVAVFLFERQIGTGRGSSKKQAEEVAAREALNLLQRGSPDAP
jgi:ribonuclease-3